MTSADGFFWTFEQAVSYYQFAVVNYIGFHDRGMVLAGGCGDTNGRPQIDKTGYLQEAYEFGKNVYLGWTCILCDCFLTYCMSKYRLVVWKDNRKMDYESR